MELTATPDSTMIEKLTYNTATKELKVLFRKGKSLYTYRDVPSSAWTKLTIPDFQPTESTGKNFHAVILKRFAFTKSDLLPSS